MLRLRNLLLAMLVIALPLFAEDDDSRFELQYAKNFTFRGGRVTVDHSFGDLVLRTHNSDQVLVRATIRASDEDIGRDIRIIASEGPTGVTIRTEYPNVHNRRGHTSYSVDMTVTVPANAPITSKNQFGNTEARGLQGTSSIDNKQGSISFRGGRGSHALSNSFGSIDATDNRGSLAIANMNGSVSVRNIEGPLSVSNRFGSISATDVKDTATLTNSNGSIEASDVHASIKATNAFGSVTLRNVQGAADVTNTNGRIELTDIGGRTTVRNSFGNVAINHVGGALTVDGDNTTVEVEDVAGAATLRSSFGGITVRNVRGFVNATNANGSVTVKDTAAAVKVRTNFGSVFIENVIASIDVVNANGAISVSGLRGGGCQPIALTTNFSSIKVELPREAAYEVNARTTFGRVHSDFAIATNGISEGVLRGTIGRGGCQLQLTNANGNINIDRD